MGKIEYVGKCVLIEEGVRKKENVLVVGDLHIGYEEKLGINGVDLGEKRFKEMIEEFEKMFRNLGIEKVGKIVLLGDLKHDFSSLTINEREKLMRFFDYLSEKCEEMVMIRGNHDNYLLNLTERNGLKIEEGYCFGKNLFVHGDHYVENMWDKKIKRVLMGHLHPSVKLREGVKIETYKCFVEGKYKGKEIVVLPSFEEIGKGLDVRELGGNSEWNFKWDKFKIKVVGEDLGILDFGKIEDLLY